MLIPLVLLFPNQSVTATEGSDILITSVIPTGGSEGVALTNYSVNDVDLTDYYLTDGEGTISFDGITLRSHSTLFILSGEPESWMQVESYVINGNGVSFDRFILNDNGDDIHLKYKDRTLDSFYYGNTEVSEGWNGDVYPKISKKHIAVRCSVFDTDSSSDWRTIVPGRTEYDALEDGYDAMISPVVFPDSKGQVILQTIAGTEHRIDISIYLLTHRDIIGILNGLLINGVEVNILIEGSPVGGMPQNEKELLSVLKNNGADIRVISSVDGYKRYSYLHTKYAVIDGEYTIITSENWTSSSFEGNRGWGAIIRSQDVASYYESVFNGDFNGKYDISEFESINKLTSVSNYYPTTYAENLQWFPAEVYPVLSPDNSWSQMRSLLTGSEEYIFIEQLDVSYDWISDDDNPLQWMINSDTEIRIIMDGSYDSPDDEDEKDSYALMEALNDIDIPVLISEDITVHNKGVITDNKVWIGSVNWTDNSFRNNREAAVILVSEDVSAYFKEQFLLFWNSLDIADDGLTVAYPDTISSGHVFLMNVPSSMEGKNIKWIIDDSIERTGTKIALELSEGSHIITVIDEDDGLTTTVELHVGSAGTFWDLPYGYYVAFIILICLAIVKTIKLFRRRHNDKGVQARRFR